MESVDLGQLFQQEAASSAPIEETLTALEAVRKCLPEIRKSRKRKLSWDSISEIVRAVVKQGYSTDIRLTGNTVRYYYYELTRKKGKGHHASARSSPQRTRTPKAQPPAIVHFPSEEPEAEKPKAVEPKEAEPIEVPTPVAPAAAAVTQEEASPKEQPDESTAATVVQGSHQPDEPSQSDPYRRPPGSRFTRGHKVKYWNGGTS